MKRDKQNRLTTKMSFINEMILESIEHEKDFRVGEINNGSFSFNDVSHFLLMKGLSKEFSEYLKINQNDILYNDINSTEIIVKEIDLPFADKKELERIEKGDE